MARRSRREVAAFTERSQWIAHTFPLRRDFLAQLVLPVNLTRQESDRLCAFLKALCPTTVQEEG